jgi:hypothetical protein
MAAVHFPFRFDGSTGAFARLVTRSCREPSGVTIDGDRLTARYGRWLVTTTVDNVSGCEITGPYRWWKVLGPPHLSLADGGLTFAGTTQEGVCIRFAESVRGLLPTARVTHPGLTVTVDDAGALVRALQTAGRKAPVGASPHE